ncbi:gephyrin-like molybdotransferase Glp [Agarilytica rhodophyticola]|uniref:molybdopterin molybdotransferase MoeA n=1 Tax=Agarilytica rhodophyticola TaxID=1737490 RepID=UPI000B3499DF|nr:gephyrin-like molybdotransferase Glp [Agarilytica rhodophyticola]
MLEVEEAQQNILAAIESITCEQSVGIAQACNRVLAHDIVAKVNVPPADNSAMDGYAVNVYELTDGQSEFPVSQRIPAGAAPSPLKAGSAARIFTGSEIPQNANAVIMQENCEALDSERVRILKTPNIGENIRACGQDIKAEHTILTKGQRLKPQHIGLIASIGESEVSVRRKIKVALLSTGDELVEPGSPLKPGQIYNSNLPMLVSFLTMMGCEVIERTIVEDSYASTCQALESSAKDADLVISTGGVSVGEEDHVKEAVKALGELAVWKVRVKPGKPLAFGKIGNTAFLGLPGNPVSAFVTFILFASPLLKKLQGEKDTAPVSFYLPVNFAVSRAQTRPEYIRVRINNGKVEKFTNQSSGVLTSVCWAQALALIPSHKEMSVGDLVQVFPLDSFYI